MGGSTGRDSGVVALPPSVDGHCHSAGGSVMSGADETDEEEVDEIDAIDAAALDEEAEADADAAALVVDEALLGIVDIMAPPVGMLEELRLLLTAALEGIAATMDVLDELDMDGMLMLIMLSELILGSDDMLIIDSEELDAGMGFAEKPV